MYNMQSSAAGKLLCGYLLHSTAHSPWVIANTALPFLQLLRHASNSSQSVFQSHLQEATWHFNLLQLCSKDTNSSKHVNFQHTPSVLWALSGRASPPSCLLVQRRSIFSFSAPKAKKFNQRRLVGWTPEQLYAVVSDVEQYHKFVPWCQKSVIKKRIPNQGYMEAELEVGFQVLVERYVSKVTLVENRLVQSKVADSMLFHHLDSTWMMEPGPSPNTCWLSFSVDFAFNSALYDQLAEVFFSEVVRRMVSAFEGRCQTLYGQSSLHRFPHAATAAAAGKTSHTHTHAPQPHQPVQHQHHKHITKPQHPQHSQHTNVQPNHKTIQQPHDKKQPQGHAAARNDQAGSRNAKQGTGRQTQSITATAT